LEEDLGDCWDVIHVLPYPHLPSSSPDVSEETRKRIGCSQEKTEREYQQRYSPNVPARAKKKIKNAGNPESTTTINVIPLRMHPKAALLLHQLLMTLCYLASVTSIKGLEYDLYLKDVTSTNKKDLERDALKLCKNKTTKDLEEKNSQLVRAF
jgi:hypothetical protein